MTRESHLSPISEHQVQQNSFPTRYPQGEGRGCTHVSGLTGPGTVVLGRRRLRSRRAVLCVPHYR